MGIVTRWIDRFFNKVNQKCKEDIINDACHNDPELGKGLNDIRQTMDKINTSMSERLNSNKKATQEEQAEFIKSQNAFYAKQRRLKLKEEENARFLKLVADEKLKELKSQYKDLEKKSKIKKKK